jgi:hypothetical protein
LAKLLGELCSLNLHSSPKNKQTLVWHAGKYNLLLHIPVQLVSLFSTAAVPLLASLEVLELVSFHFSTPRLSRLVQLQLTLPLPPPWDARVNIPFQILATLCSNQAKKRRINILLMQQSRPPSLDPNNYFLREYLQDGVYNNVNPIDVCTKAKKTASVQHISFRYFRHVLFIPREKFHRLGTHLPISVSRLCGVFQSNPPSSRQIS